MAVVAPGIEQLAPDGHATHAAEVEEDAHPPLLLVLLLSEAAASSSASSRRNGSARLPKCCAISAQRRYGSSMATVSTR